MTTNFNTKAVCTLLALLLFVLSSTGFSETPKSLNYKIIHTLPHDPLLFTQGLELKNGNLIESSGHFNRSFIRIYNAATGQTLKQAKLPAQIFAEGITLHDRDLYLLSWKAGVVFVLDPDTLKVRKTQSYKGEGWGIAHNDSSLFTSDGSHRITQRNPKNFSSLKVLEVTNPASGERIDRLNELEFAQGRLWANRWQTNWIYTIDPQSGKILGTLNLNELVPPSLAGDRDKVLNGIAFDAERNAFWITGKNWPLRYLIEIREK
ncbi:glutaminyl-peptide cyclotransferase [Teredinibacter haidensis]|uniref:glutaminyl-peptide cyclotransferase n=1 Tax=Teredinibacter haidensis TaxID=2731755 RepID=UPI000948A811|nr:glutaminyl-peptide cyclotransferase [Teredinibacter haidensis]